MRGRSNQVIRGPIAYSSVAVARRLRTNYAVYLSIATALIVPGLAYLCRETVLAQGESLGGAGSRLEFASAIGMIAVLGVVVGFIQISLVLARMLNARNSEFKLLLATVTTPSQTLGAVLIEALMHSGIGWFLAILSTGIFVALAHWLLSVPWPGMLEFTLVGALYGPLAASAVLCPTMLFFWRISKFGNPSAREVER